MLTPDWLDVMGSVSGSTGPLAPPPSQRSVVGREVCGPGPGGWGQSDLITRYKQSRILLIIYIVNTSHGWSDVETQQQRMIVETEDGQPHHHRGQ